MKDTKEHILKTSLLLFLQKSYRDVTMSEIVQKTGLSKGAFYHYFASKEALFKEIASMFLTMGGINYIGFNKNSLQSFYLEYIDSVNNSMLEMNRMVTETDSQSFNLNFFLILFEAAGRFPEFLEMELEFHKKDMKAWTNVISASRQNGEISSDSSDEEIANLFLYCSDGVFIRFINNENTLTFKEYLSKAFDAIYINLKV